MMNGNEMAAFVLSKMGGEMTPQRQDSFQKMCQAIVEYLQTHMQVTSVGTAPPGGGPVTTTSTIIL